MAYFVLTNNPLVKKSVSTKVTVIYKSCGIKEIFLEASHYIADGYTLLTHPLSGSVKPGETPYKTMLFNATPQADIDKKSANLITSAIAACEKFPNKSQFYNEKTLHDCQVIDMHLIQPALNAVRT